MNRSAKKIEDSRNIAKAFPVLRFILFMVGALMLGILFFANVDPMPFHQTVKSYFSAFQADSLNGFFKNAFYSASFELIMILSAIISAMTFFCPALLRISCLICGAIYGICISILINNCIEIYFLTAYVIYAVLFIVVYSFGCAMLFRINHLCIINRHTPGPDRKRIFISPILCQYTVGSLHLLITFCLLRLLYSIILLLLNQL